MSFRFGFFCLLSFSFLSYRFSFSLQTIISRLCHIFNNNLFETDNAEERVEKSSIESIILSFSHPLIHEMYWLGKEMSASHVLRSLLCLLSGLPTIAEKKGKNSKHQHAVLFSEPLDLMIAANAYYLNHKKSFPVPSSFKEEILNGFSSFVSTKSKHDLQLFIADSSSCALLTLLLKIISNPFLFSSETILPFMKQFIEKVLGDSSSDVFYAMAGDKLGSFFLETLLTVVQPFDQLILPLYQRSIQGNIKDYCFDHYGNYVIQALLKRLVVEAAPATSSSSESEVVPSLFQEIFQEIIEMKTSLSFKEWNDLILHKSGIFYWFLEAALILHNEKAFLQITKWILSVWKAESVEEKEREEVSGDDTEKTVVTEKIEQDDVTVHPSNTDLVISITRYLEKKFTEKEVKPSSLSSLGGKPKGKEEKEQQQASELTVGGQESNVSSKLLLSKFIKLFLQTFSASSSSFYPASFASISFFTMKCLLSLSASSFETIISVSAINKNILDTVFLEYGTTNNSQSSEGIASNNSSSKGLSSELSSQKVSYLKQFSMKMIESEFLSLFLSSFYGIKILYKIYEHCDYRGKEKWISSFSSPEIVKQLSKSKNGRDFVEFLHLDVYLNDPKEWKLLAKKEGKESRTAEEKGKKEADAVSKGQVKSLHEQGKKVEKNRNHDQGTSAGAAGKKETSSSSKVVSQPPQKKQKVESTKEKESGMTVDDVAHSEDEVDDANNEDAAGGKKKRKRKRPQKKKPTEN
jgi:hypothetical protein